MQSYKRFCWSVERKAEQPMWKRTANGANKKLALHVRLRCGSLSITTPVPFLANEFDVWRVLHAQVSLEAVNQIYVILVAMNGCKNLDLIKACFENVNITLWKFRVGTGASYQFGITRVILILYGPGPKAWGFNQIHV